MSPQCRTKRSTAAGRPAFSEISVMTEISDQTGGSVKLIFRPWRDEGQPCSPDGALKARHPGAVWKPSPDFARAPKARCAQSGLRAGTCTVACWPKVVAGV